MAERKKGKRCVVIGAGMAGLNAARIMADAGLDVTVLEKDDRPGGRMSTHAFSGGIFDDGAQFFTVKDQRFGTLVEDWVHRGVVGNWFQSQLIRGGASNPDGFPRYCGTKGMRSIIDDLAKGLDVRTGVNVTALNGKKGSYTLKLGNGEEWNADAVVLTAPVPQALGLLATGGLKLADTDRKLLEQVDYSPCLTVLAVLDAPSSGLTEWGGLRVQGEYIDWIADNHLKGISGACAVTIQAMPEFSRERWAEDDDAIAARLLDNAKALLLAQAKAWRVMRWKLAKPLAVHPFTHVAAAGAPTCVLAGDGFQGYRVEGAAISGMEAGESIVRQLA